VKGQWEQGAKRNDRYASGNLKNGDRDGMEIGWER